MHATSIGALQHRAIERARRYIEDGHAEAASRAELDRFLIDTVCNPDLDIPEQRLEPLADRCPRLGEALRTCLRLNDLVGVPRPAPAPRPDPALDHGAELGESIATGQRRYRVLGRLASGRGGVVYLALDRLMSSPTHTVRVAIKTARITSPLHANQMLDEARRARRVSHPSVASALDAGVAGSLGYCVFRLVHGTALSQREPRTIAPRDTVRLIAAAADGIAAVHAAGLVHGDLKPSNIVLQEDLKPVIVDFGSAAEMTAQLGNTPDNAPRAFSLAFCAPEQILRLDRAALPGSDIYALGAIAVWMLTGSHAAGDDAAAVLRTHAADADHIRARAATLLRQARTPDALARILLRATAHDPAGRHASAAELAHDLRRWLDHRPIEWQRPGPLRRGRLLARRRPLTIALAAVATLAAAATAVQTHRSRYLSRAIAEQHTQIQVQHARAQAEQQWKSQAADRLAGLFRGFSAARQKGLHEDVLLSLWLLEWSHGSGVLADPDALDQLWETRVAVLQDARERHRGSIIARLTEPSLALWLIAAERSDEAQDLLSDSLAYWTTILSEDDPWLQTLRTLEAVAIMTGTTSGPAERERALDQLVTDRNTGVFGTLPRAVRLRAERAIDARGRDTDPPRPNP